MTSNKYLSTRKDESRVAHSTGQIEVLDNERQEVVKRKRENALKNKNELALQIKLKDQEKQLLK